MDTSKTIQAMNDPVTCKIVENSVWERRFLLSVSFILCITATAKLISATGQANILDEKDPIFGVPFTSMLSVVGFLELMVGILCLSKKLQPLALALTAWLSISFMSYRFGLWWVGWERPCPCLGSLTENIGLQTSTADTIMTILLLYLLLGAFSFLIGSINQTSKQITS